MLVALIPCWLFILLNLFIYGCFLLCGSSYAVGMVWGARTSTSPAPPEKPHRPQRQGLWYHHQQQHHHLTQYEHTAADASIPDAEKHAAHATQVSLENTLRIYHPLDMKGRVCHLKWQTHPFISKGTICNVGPPSVCDVGPTFIQHGICNDLWCPFLPSFLKKI